MAGSRDEIIRYVYEVTGSKELREVARQLTATGDVSEELESSIREMADEFARLDQAAKAARSIGGLKAELQETGDKLFLARRALADLNAQFSASDKSSRQVARAFAAAEKSVSDLAREEQRLELALLKANGAVTKAGGDINNLAASEAKLASRTKEVVSAARDFAVQADKASKSTANLEGSTNRLGSMFASAREGLNSFVGGLLRITGIAGAVSAALGAISGARVFGGAIRSAKEFEAALSDIRAVTGATADEMEQMRAASEAASQATAFSAHEAAGALGELARASGSAQAAIAQLPATLNLAQAAGIGASEAANILTTTITQFGLAATDAARVADLFAREANSTQDTVSGLGLAMSYVAPLARQLGMSLEDATATLGALAEQGFRGERAGTALRNVFSALQDPTSKFREALNSLGISGNDFSAILEQLAARGEEGKTALLSLDAAARPAIMSLVNTGGAGLRKLREDLRQAGGEAARTAEVMGQNFAGASSRFGNALDALRRALVQPILEPLAREFDAAANRVRAFIETADFQALAATIRDFAVSAAQALREFVASIDFKSVMESLRGYIDTVGEWFTSLKDNSSKAISALSAAGNTLSTVWNGLQTAILTVAAGITIALSGIIKGVERAVRALALMQGGNLELTIIANRLKEEIGGLDAVATEFWNRAKTNAAETGQAFNGLVEDVSALTGANKETAAAAGEAATAIDDFDAKLAEWRQSLGISEESAASLNEEVAATATEATAAADALQSLGATSTAELGTAAGEMRNVAGAAREASRDVQQIGEAAKESSANATHAFASAQNAMAGWIEHFGQTSQAAALEFNRLTAAIFESGRSFSTLVDADTTGIARLGQSINLAAELTEQALGRQRDAVTRMTEEYGRMAEAGAEAFTGAGGNLDDASARIAGFIAQLRDGKSEFRLLGQQDLAGLISAAERARDRIAQIGEAARKARQDLADMADSYRDQIDQIEGNAESQELRRHERELERLRERAEAAGEANSAEYHEAVRQAERLHELKMRQIRDQQAAQRSANEAASYDPPTSSGGGGGSYGGGGMGGGSQNQNSNNRPTNTNGSGSASYGATVNVNITGGLFFGEDRTRAMQQMARDLKAELDRIARLDR